MELQAGEYLWNVSYRIERSVVPISAGVGETAMPAARKASILAEAVPLPPEMIAPA